MYRAPAVLDGALRFSAPHSVAYGKTVVSPGRVRRVRYFGQGTGTGWSHVRLREGDADATTIVADVTLLSDNGQKIGLLEGFSAKRVDTRVLARLGSARLDDWFYRIEWHEAPAPAATTTAGKWLVFARTRTPWRLSWRG